jgi:hypothetical protein
MRKGWSKFGVALLLTVFAGLILVVLAIITERRVHQRHDQFYRAIGSIQKGMAEAQVHEALGQPLLSMDVEKGSHPALVFESVECRKAGSRRVLAYRFEHKTWAIPEGPVYWFIVCLNETGRVMDTINMRTTH